MCPGIHLRAGSVNQEALDYIARTGLKPPCSKPKPLRGWCSKDFKDELAFLRNQVDLLRGQKVSEDQVAVLLRRKDRVREVQESLKGYTVLVQTAHSFKGLETEVVLLPFLQDMFGTEADEQRETADRRLAYMGMSRARSQLLMSYSGRLPRQLEDLRRENLADFVG